MSGPSWFWKYSLEKCLKMQNKSIILTKCTDSWLERTPFHTFSPFPFKYLNVLKHQILKENYFFPKTLQLSWRAVAFCCNNLNFFWLSDMASELLNYALNSMLKNSLI